MRLTAGDEKPICAVCSGDLDPTIDDVHALTICGHVFHGFCLHGLLEDAKKRKSPSARCPLCKQSFSGGGGGGHSIRLFFNFVPDMISPPKDTTTRDGELMKYADLLTKEARKIEEDVSSYAFSFRSQQEAIDQLTKELSLLKRQSEKDDGKMEKMKKKHINAGQLLSTKMEELFNNMSECRVLRQKTLRLEKKLVPPPNSAIECDFVDDQKVDSPGSVDPENVVVVRKSSTANGKRVTNLQKGAELALSFNKGKRSYDELNAHCETLANAGRLNLKKLDKADKKMRKLKANLLGLEKSIEN